MTFLLLNSPHKGGNDRAMARPLRIQYNGAFYHITARGNDRKKIFFSKGDYEKFKEYLGNALEKYEYVLHCYMLMTNHYHLLIETPNGNLSKIMHYLNGSYTNYINRRKRKNGHLFQGRYKAILIDKDSFLLELSRYIHLNPVRANMVQKPEDYVQSSYRWYIGKNRGNSLVYKDLILKMISRTGSASKRYKEFVESGINENIENPSKDLFASSILGSKDFVKEALSRLKDGILEKKEISYRKDLDSAYTVDRVINYVADHFKISNDEIIQDRGEYRKIAIYIIKKKTSLTNRQVGELFGGLSYSAVAKVYERFSKHLSHDKKKKKNIAKIITYLSDVKG